MVQIVSVTLRRFVVVLALVVLSALVFALPAIAARGTVSTTLSGAEEAPPVATEGTGTAKIKLNTSKETKKNICYGIDVSNLSSSPNGAHIHKGPPGVDGGIVVVLNPPSGTDGQSSGCKKANRALVKDILENPSDYYVNIHTPTNPDGEVRGQLKAGPLSG